MQHQDVLNRSPELALTIRAVVCGSPAGVSSSFQTSFVPRSGIITASQRVQGTRLGLSYEHVHCNVIIGGHCLPIVLFTQDYI